MIPSGVVAQAVQEDGADILSIARGTGFFSEEEVACVDELWQEFIQAGVNASGYDFQVFKLDGELLGFACFGPRPLTSGVYDLYWLATDARHQGKGVGKALLRTVEQEVRRAGGHLLIAETSGKELYAPTRAFYLAAGYKLEATLRDGYSPGEDMVIFTRHFS